MATYSLTRILRLDLDSFARSAGLHPDLVRRLVDLGLLDPVQDARGDLWFDRAELVRMARLRRLHAGLPLTYSSLGIVAQLLDRIAQLEDDARHASVPSSQSSGPSTAARAGGHPWT